MAFRSEILIKLDKKGRVLLPAAFRDELPADDRGAFVLYHSPNLPGVVNGNSRAGFDAMLDRLRAEALGPKGALKVALDDEAFDPAGYLSAIRPHHRHGARRPLLAAGRVRAACSRSPTA